MAGLQFSGCWLIGLVGSWLAGGWWACRVELSRTQIHVPEYLQHISDPAARLRLGQQLLRVPVVVALSAHCVVARWWLVCSQHCATLLSGEIEGVREPLHCDSGVWVCPPMRAFGSSRRAQLCPRSLLGAAVSASPRALLGSAAHLLYWTRLVVRVEQEKRQAGKGFCHIGW